MKAPHRKDTCKEVSQNVSGTRVGEKLRQARDKKSLSIKDCHNALRIRTSFLEALETGDLKALPTNRTVVCAYISQYAEFLGLESSVVLRAFNDTCFLVADRNIEHYTPSTDKTQSGQQSTGNVILLIIVALLALVLIIGAIQNTLLLPPETEIRMVAPDVPAPHSKKPEAISNNLKNISDTQTDTGIDITSDPDFVVRPLALNEGSVAPPVVLPPQLELSGLNSTPTMLRLINAAPTWVAMRGGSLSQEYQVMLDAHEGLIIPFGEGVSLRVGTPGTLQAVFGNLSDTEDVDTDSDANPEVIIPYSRLLSALGVDPLQQAGTWIEIDRVLTVLR